MANDGIAKVQHYVPRFLLRNFGTGKKDKLHVFDKQSDLVFATNVKNVAAESRFYDFEVGGATATIEPTLSGIEGSVKPILKSILEADSLRLLSIEDRAKFCVFLSVQFTRTKWFREQFRLLPSLLEQRLRRSLGEDADLSSAEDLIRVPDDNESVAQAAHVILDAPKDYAKQFANKLWVLVATDPRHPFLIGDNPIALQNKVDTWPFGNLGLAVQGIEIYFPLSPLRALAMFCPSHGELFLAAAAHEGEVGFAHEVLRAMELGSPLDYPPECVLNFNSLQVRHAERFLFSNIDDFSLAREMIAAHESYKTGPRPTVN
jgi:hypothetical protein